MTALQNIAIRRIANLARDMKIPAGHAGSFQDQNALREHNLTRAKEHAEADEIRREIVELAQALQEEID